MANLNSTELIIINNLVEQLQILDLREKMIYNVHVTVFKAPP
jgi:hypothetical protein